MRKLLVIALLLATIAVAQEAAVQPTQLDLAYQYVYAQWARAKLDDSENAQGKAALQFLYQNAKSWEMYQVKVKESADATTQNAAPVAAVPVESPESGGSK